MHKLNLLYNEHLGCVDIHSFVNFTGDALPDHFALDPLDHFTMDFDGIVRLR